MFPKETCPYCKNESCQADFVDNGVGYQQCGPYYCAACGAIEIGPYDDIKTPLDPQEECTGWYLPGRSQTCVATLDGVPLDHVTAKALYRIEYYLNHQPKTVYDCVTDPDFW